MRPPVDHISIQQTLNSNKELFSKYHWKYKMPTRGIQFWYCKLLACRRWQEWRWMRSTSQPFAWTNFHITFHFPFCIMYKRVSFKEDCFGRRRRWIDIKSHFVQGSLNKHQHINKCCWNRCRRTGGRVCRFGQCTLACSAQAIGRGERNTCQHTRRTGCLSAQMHQNLYRRALSGGFPHANSIVGCDCVFKMRNDSENLSRKIWVARIKCTFRNWGGVAWFPFALQRARCLVKKVRTATHIPTIITHKGCTFYSLCPFTQYNLIGFKLSMLNQ